MTVGTYREGRRRESVFRGVEGQRVEWGVVGAPEWGRIFWVPDCEKKQGKHQVL